MFALFHNDYPECVPKLIVAVGHVMMMTNLAFDENLVLAAHPLENYESLATVEVVAQDCLMFVLCSQTLADVFVAFASNQASIDRVPIEDFKLLI